MYESNEFQNHTEQSIWIIAFKAALAKRNTVDKSAADGDRAVVAFRRRSKNIVATVID